MTTAIAVIADGLSTLLATLPAGAYTTVSATWLGEHGGTLTLSLSSGELDEERVDDEEVT